MSAGRELGVQRFPSEPWFSHSEFCFGLRVPGGSRVVCWISSESDKIWMGWRKSEGFSLSLGKGPGSDSVAVFSPNAKVLVV